MESQKVIKQEIVDHNLQVKAIIQVSENFLKHFAKFHFSESRIN